MKTEWILKSYSSIEADDISKKILKKTKNTVYINKIKSFICKNKNDLNIVHKFLYEDYYKTHIKYNLIEQSLKNFILETNEWKTFD